MTEQLDLARQGWLSFTAATPLPLPDFSQQDLTTLPFLRTALLRHLEEFPDHTIRLSRHERQIPELIRSGTPPANTTDKSFYTQSLQLTNAGLPVLNGEADWMELNAPDFWKAGVHLHLDTVICRWNPRKPDAFPLTPSSQSR